MKGTKRFKKQSQGVGDIGAALDVDFASGSVDAKAIFRKITTTTSYSKTFGEKPAEEKDHNILTKKKFSELQISEVLKPEVVQIISKWLMINDQDKFTGRIYNTVREIFTVIKNQMAELPTSHDIFATQKNIPSAKAPRFDKTITNLREEIRQRNQSLQKVD